MNSEPNVSYHDKELAWSKFSETVRKLIEENQFKRICEVGGGGNPTIELDYIHEHSLEYTLLDISAEELNKAPDGYIKVVADIASPDLNLAGGKYDLIFSKMLAEHVKDGRTFHRNIYKLLGSNGLAFHFFPTLYSPPFLINYLMPQALSAKLLAVFQPRDMFQHGKFPAYYSFCRGPSQKQIAFYKNAGYVVERFQGYFGHSYYKKIPVVYQLHLLLRRFLIAHPLPFATSFAYIFLRKPG